MADPYVYCRVWVEVITNYYLFLYKAKEITCCSNALKLKNWVLGGIILKHIYFSYHNYNKHCYSYYKDPYTYNFILLSMKLRKLQQTFSSQTQESLCLQYYMVNGNNQWQQCTVYNSFCYTIWSIVYAKHERMIFLYVTHPCCIHSSILLLILAVNSNI